MKKLLFVVVALAIMLGSIASVFMTPIAATDAEPPVIQDLHWWSNVSDSTPDAEFLPTPDVNAPFNLNSFTRTEASDAVGLTIPASKDTAIGFTGTLGPDTNHGSRPSFVAWNDSPYADLTSLLEFSLASVPADAEICYANLALYGFNSDGYSNIPVGVYKQLHTDWEELQATYNIYKTGSSWTTQGGDYVTSNPVGTEMMVPPASQGWVQWNITDIVNDARNRSIPVELLVKATAYGNDYSDVGFISKEYSSDPTLQPRLFIAYTTDGTPTPTPTPTATPWSFAIITDTHIGEGYYYFNDSTGKWESSDYGTFGWNDDPYSGQETWWDNTSGLAYELKVSSVWNLKEAVGWANNASNPNDPNYYNTKFVVIDGDLTNSAELSELQKAKDILQTLSIPWIPIIGNHDVWPYYGAKTFLASTRDNEQASVINGQGTDQYFNDFYGDQDEIFANQSGVSLNKSSIPIWNELEKQNDTGQNSYFQNFCFDYNGYHLIGLDFNTRNKAPWFFGWQKGVPPWASYNNIVGSTREWFLNNLNQYASINGYESEKVILFSHHPMYFWGDSGFLNVGKLADDLRQYKDNILVQFCGHLHEYGFDTWNGPAPIGLNNFYKSIKTGANYQEPQVRIVQVFPNGSIDYDTILPKDAASITIHCPVDLILTDPDGLVINRLENQVPDAMYYKWDFDEDGQLETKIWIPERKQGIYSIQVIPEPGANASDTFTLTVSPMEQKWGYTPITLAQNVTIANIPAEPYTFEFKQRITTNLSYTGDLNGYKFDTVNLTAALFTENGSPLSGKTVNFVIGDQSASAVTDVNGVATASLTINQTPSQFYYVECGFDGDKDYLPYYDNQQFEIINRLPVANVGGPYTGTEGSPITFNGCGSYDPDGTIVSYDWNFGDGSPTVNGTLTPAHTYTLSGNYTVTLTVTDNDGGIGTDTVAINVIPPPPTTTTYTFTSGGGMNKWCSAGHIHLIDWIWGHPHSPWDLSASPTYGFVSGGSTEYTKVSSSDNVWWKSNISHCLGCCAFDRNAELFTFKIAENPSTITNIQIKWEGHGTTGETIYYTTEKLWKYSNSTWTQLRNQRNVTSDTTWTNNITNSCSDYVESGTGNLSVLVSSQRSGLPNNCGIWTDYIEVTITHN